VEPELCLLVWVGISKVKRVIYIVTLLLAFAIIVNGTWQSEFQSGEWERTMWARLDTLNDHVHSVNRCYPTLADGVTVAGASTGGVL
jgi:hypothetical protein